MQSEKVVVLGASPKRERYSNMAQRLLMEIGCTVIPVNPGQSEIEGVPVTRNLSDIPGSVDTVTMYVSPDVSEKLTSELIRLKPQRVIFNPGTESPTLQATLEKSGIAVQEACTLVLIRTGQWAPRVVSN
jgi:predicted CoA-binding protein